MSISYFAVATDDRTKIGPLVEGALQPGVPPLDVAALYRVLTEGTALRGPANATLRWQDAEGGYVFADLRPTHVEITQGTGGGDDSIDVIMIVIDRLNGAGLNVYDPQQGTWFPGSPVTPKKTKKPAAKAKKKPAKKTPAAKAKKKPAAKAKKKPAKKPKR